MSHDLVRDYYGARLGSSGDLRTDACCDMTAVPAAARKLLANIHPDVTARYFGCGTVIPDGLAGATVVDLGCGTGRDVYLLAQLVGPEGRVIGIDMTPEQLAVARETLPWHRARFGAECPAIEFHEGLIEHLDALPVAAGLVDVIVSNCVINLAQDKGAVFRGARRLLRPEGAVHFADVYADRPVPTELRADPVLLGECLSGALDWEGFERLVAASGFAPPELLASRPLGVTDPTLLARLGEIRFTAATCRLSATARPGAMPPGHPDFGEPRNGSCCG